MIHSMMTRPIGNDTLAAIEQKMAFVATEMATWRALSSSTGFDD